MTSRFLPELVFSRAAYILMGVPQAVDSECVISRVWARAEGLGSKAEWPPLATDRSDFGMNTDELEGLAYLCFFDDGSWFQGTLLTEDKKQYGLMGETCDPPEEGFAECCFEDEPLFYMITIIDHKLNEEMVFKHVMKTGGDNCTLTSNEIEFETEQLFVGSKAESHVSKYCRSELKGKECIVCSGHMLIHRSDQSD